MATLECAGILDDNICLSFAKMIRRYIEKSTGRQPLLFSGLISNLKNYHQSLQIFFNAIA